MPENLRLKIKKLDPRAVLPSYAFPHDAGLDLCALEKITLIPGERQAIRTGLALAIPPGYVGLIWDKSGVGIKGGLKVLGGVIDAGYRGEILIGMVNLSEELYTFAAGHKVAQLLIQKIEQPKLVIVDELDNTDRDAGGFGSSGK